MSSSSTIFQQILTKSGIDLESNGQPILRVDQAIFQRNVYLALKGHHNYPEVVNEFLVAFREFVDSQRHLWLWLNPTKTDTEFARSRGVNQPSLIHLLLGNADLQARVIRILFEILVELRSKDDDEIDGSMFADEVRPQLLPKLILYQFRQLDALEDGKGFIDTVQEIFDCVSLEDQKELISMIPEILPDSRHEAAAACWSDLLKTRQDLTLAILDSLLVMHISDHTLEEVKQTVSQGMDAAKVEDLPMIVKFLTKSVSAGDATEVIAELKTKLNVNLLTESTTKVDEKKSVEVLMMESLRLGIQFRPIVGDTLLKLYETDLSESKKWTVADFLVALVMLSTPSRTKAMEKLVLKTVRKGTVSKTLIRTTLRKFPQICNDYFSTVVAVARMAIACREDVVLRFGQLLYECVFSCSDSLGIQQGVVEAICKHAHRDQSDEKNAALDLLKRLVVKEPRKMARFGHLLKGFLDYIGIYDLASVRKVYAILGSQSSDSGNRELLDDFHIIVRKQLSNSCPKYRRMGVIGVTALLKTSLPSQDDSSPSDPDFRETCGLLETAEKFMAKEPEALALFYDELSGAVQRKEVHPSLLAWILDKVNDDFQDRFIVDVTKEGRLAKEPAVQGELMFRLDKETEVGIALDVVSATSDGAASDSGVRKSPDGSSLTYLASQLRLLSCCELSKNGGSLEDIDALLGCPIHFVSKEKLDSFLRCSEAEQRMICRCCFGLVNWCNELVNAFCNQTDPEMQRKVLDRLRLIVQIRSNLADFLSAMGGFAPPVAHFDAAESERVRVPRASTNKKKPKPNKSHEKKTGDSDDEVDEDGDEDQEPATAASAKGQGKKRKRTKKDDSTSQTADQDGVTKKADLPPVDLSLFQLCFRELDIGVFRALKYQLSLKPGESTPDLHLKLDDLLFLLNDFREKLDVALQEAGGQAKRRLPFGKAKTSCSSSVHYHLLQMSAEDVAHHAIKLLPSIRGHLDAITTYMASDAVSDDDDDVAFDEPTVCRDVLSDVLRCLFDVVNAILKWSGFGSSRYDALFVSALEEFAAAQPTGDHLKDAFSYFCGVLEMSPNVSCATRLVGVLDKLASKGSSRTLTDSLADVTLILLKKDWKRTARTAKDRLMKDGDLLALLRIYFKNDHDKLNALEMLSTKAFQDLLEGDDDFAPNYPTLTKASVPVYYRILHEELIELVKQRCVNKRDESDEEQLLLWSLSLKIFGILVNLIKEYSTPRTIGLCLKNSRLFVELFIKNAMPLMDRTFKTHGDDVQSMLKTLQLSTRFLQHVCSHSKVTKAVGLTSYVPPLRKVLEQVIYRVKAMLTLNNCKRAFWIGNLKNRNLQGQEILSQDTTAASGTTAEKEPSSESDDVKASDDGGGDEDDQGNASESY